MGISKLSIAIISDLHCYHISSSNTLDSYLTTNKSRSNPKDHPVEGIIDLIKKENLSVDLTLCPGDFTNKSDQQGFISGWDFSLEIHGHLKGNQIIATIGNHDVDSYGTHSDYSLELAKGIRKGFPIDDEVSRDTFWSKGCVFIEGRSYRVLVINSSHFHYNKDSAASGRVDDSLVDYVEKYLDKASNDKINIALSHHHPIDHSRLSLGEEDKIVNADALLEVLGKFKFDLFIHGHKHDPLLRYHNCSQTNHKIPILSSGSFSATTNLSWTSKRNTFHKIDLVKDGSLKAKGKIKSWTFLPRNGWSVISDDGGFHPYTGFGNTDSLEQITRQIIGTVGSNPITKWSDVVTAVPNVEFLMPNEAEDLMKLLKAESLIISPKIWEMPEYISNVKSIGT
ncbi:putative phosphodiesterase [Algoriphagus iocasae]|uniref:Putative phosphodiesterase n=1 Tax=Algoriphagus iocasae TaxID=1836499 RepID=A0A841MS89_9BACT|nr:metallophosphoesterase [Algoriphagus iocasae]MBB6328397.1 putative phosphodiesterase [Algoriphagus iocasae]